MQEPQAFIAEDCPTSFFDSYDIPGVYDDFPPLLEAICYPLVFLTRVIPSTISIPHHIVKRMQWTLRKKGSCHATMGGIGEVNTNLDSPLVIVGMMTSPPMAVLLITTGMAVDCTAEKNAFKVKNRETYSGHYESEETQFSYYDNWSGYESWFDERKEDTNYDDKHEPRYAYSYSQDEMGSICEGFFGYLPCLTQTFSSFWWIKILQLLLLSSV